jgi:hypothetical protein
MNNHPQILFKDLGRSFLVGVAQGFGTIIGATIGVVILIHFLGKLAVVPFIGKFVAEIVTIVQNSLSNY